MIFIIIMVDSAASAVPTHSIHATTLWLMQETFNYTTIVAPVVFFISGIFIVLVLNKFIGKNSGEKKA